MHYILLFHDLLLDEYHLSSCYLLTQGMIHLTPIIITVTGMMTGLHDYQLDYMIVRTSTPDIPVFPDMFLLIPEI